MYSPRTSASVYDNIYAVGGQNGQTNIDVSLDLALNSPNTAQYSSSWNAVEAYASGNVKLTKDVVFSANMARADEYGLQFTGLRVFGFDDGVDKVPSVIHSEGNVTIRDSSLTTESGALRFYGLQASVGELLDTPLSITNSEQVLITNNALRTQDGNALATGVKASEYSVISLKDISIDSNTVTVSENGTGSSAFLGIHSATDGSITTTGQVNIQNNKAGELYSLVAEGGRISVASGEHHIEGDMKAFLGNLYKSSKGYEDLFHEDHPFIDWRVDTDNPVYENGGLIEASFDGSNAYFSGFTSDGEALTDPSGLGQYADIEVSSIYLDFSNGACWNVVPSNAVTADARGSYVSNLTGLSLDGSSVYVGSTADSWINNTQSNDLFASTFAPLSSTDTPTELVVSHLSGAGDFYLRTELNGEGETDRSDSVRITESIDYAESPFLLHVKGSGSKLEQTDSYLVRTESDVVVTGADSGTAVTGNEFALYGGQVDIGEYIYTLENASRNDGREWYLVRNNTMSPTGETEAALSGFAGHYAMWYGYQTDLRKRLGEIRYGTQTGLWIRGFADKVRLDGLGGTNFTQNLVGGSIGYDTLADVDETYMWLVGMQIRSGHADQRTNGRWDGYGDLTSIGGGLYSTWVHVDGWYLDAVATMDWFNHEIRTSMLDGTGVHDDRSSYGIGASLEAGRKINFTYSNEDRDYWFLEPQLQLSWFWVRGGDYRADNGMTIEQNDMASLTGRAGLVLGKKFTLEDDPFHPRYVQPYIKAGVNHEFLGDQTARINGHRYTSELDGTRVYYGFGADWQATDNLRIYMQAEREHGENFTREYNVSAGLKFKF